MTNIARIRCTWLLVSTGWGHLMVSVFVLPDSARVGAIRIIGVSLLSGSSVRVGGLR